MSNVSIDTSSYFTYDLGLRCTCSVSLARVCLLLIAPACSLGWAGMLLYPPPCVNSCEHRGRRRRRSRAWAPSCKKPFARTLRLQENQLRKPAVLDRKDGAPR